MCVCCLFVDTNYAGNTEQATRTGRAQLVTQHTDTSEQEDRATAQSAPNDPIKQQPNQQTTAGRTTLLLEYSDLPIEDARAHVFEQQVAAAGLQRG